MFYDNDDEGSPPRVRELPSVCARCPSLARITPACAGITVKPFCTCTGVRDHPRVCGNYLISTISNVDLPGSPPRVRELPLHFSTNSARSGITPACAGITSVLHGGDGAAEDHPRVCGNYRSSSSSLIGSAGSPPRVRELREVHALDRCFPRITPACAGITNLRAFAKKYDEDHPRVCGNYFSSSTTRWPRAGSPPRVRELLSNSIHLRKCRGITPACAGITSYTQQGYSKTRDHPRVCGNYCRKPTRCLSRAGSPPRVRELR